jgi:hypothetical protein
MWSNRYSLTSSRYTLAFWNNTLAFLEQYIMMQVIELSEFKSTKVAQPASWRRISEPYAIWFVYPKDQQPVVVKGMCSEVAAFVMKTYPKALCRYTYWKNGSERGGWKFTCPKMYVVEGRRRKIVTIYTADNNPRELSFRRLPKKWIPEFDT